MALSPADFYAYSRATGAPVPEDPEERARLAPAVLEYRRNQLKNTEEQPRPTIDPLSLGVGLGLVAAGGIGGIGGALGIRRLLKGPARSATAPIRPVNLDEIVERRPVAERIRKEYTPKETTPSVVEPSRVVEQQQTQIPDPWSGQEKVPPKSFARQFLEDEGSLAPAEDLTSIQENQRDFVVQQQVEAVDSGLDQAVDKTVVIPKQRDVTSFQVFSQRADQITSEVAAQRAAADALAAQKSKAPKNARMLQSLGPKYGLTQDEIFHRISASASDYRPGSMEPMSQLDYAALLDPTVPTENVKDLLGTTLAVRGGRVGRNLDYEVMSEGAGMTERNPKTDVVVGEYGSDVFAYNPRTGQYEIDTSTDLEDLNLNRGRTTDYEANAADYGDVEGPGGFVLTKGFKERTKSGTTIIPGQVTETAGTLRGSERQEREIDRVLPARETLEGDPAAGWVFDPVTGRTYLTGTGTRNVKEIYKTDPQTGQDILIGTGTQTILNVAGKPVRVVSREPGKYQGQIIVDDPSYDPSSGGKLTGRFQPATAEPSRSVDTQPVTGFMSAQERLIKDEKGNWYVNQAKTKVVGETPLVGYLKESTTLTPVSLDRQEATNVLNNGAQLWASKRKEGEGSALDRQIFLINHLDDYLKTQKKIKLPILQQNEKGRIDSAAFDFINNIQPGIKETSVYVKPARVNQEGEPLVHRQTSRSGYVKETPLVDPYYEEMDAVPLPGFTKISGAGGVDVREIDENLDDRARTYFAPLIETASQQKVLRLGKTVGVPAEQMVAATTTPLGQLLSSMRSEMETAPVGYKVKSPGSFARTQNPYTGAAAAAMGPASRVSSGNYQYPEQQLRFNLQPTSLRQLDERNQFALTANLTPGGRVVRGGLQLGQGIGAIPAGLGTLSESETVARYGATGSQLQDFGNQLMAQAAYKKGIQPGPTVMSAVEKTPVPGGTAQLFIPLEGAPELPRGYTPNNALDFYARALEQEAAQLATNQPKERMVRRQGRMVPLSQTTKPYQRNVFFPNS
jgi:hypothetical protein